MLYCWHLYFGLKFKVSWGSVSATPLEPFSVVSMPYGTFPQSPGVQFSCSLAKCKWAFLVLAEPTWFDCCSLSLSNLHLMVSFHSINIFIGIDSHFHLSVDPYSI